MVKDLFVDSIKEYVILEKKYYDLSALEEDFDAAFERFHFNEWIDCSGKLGEIEERIGTAVTMLCYQGKNCMKTILSDINVASDEELKDVFGEMIWIENIRSYINESEAEWMVSDWFDVELERNMTAVEYELLNMGNETEELENKILGILNDVLSAMVIED